VGAFRYYHQASEGCFGSQALLQAATAYAQNDLSMSFRQLTCFLREHDLIAKPVSTFADHARVSID
jgi:hypothetical protein